MPLLQIHPIGPDWDRQRSRLGALRQMGFTPRTVLDVGAYRSYWSSVIKETTWPTAQYHLIEADEDCEPWLKESGFTYDIALLGGEEKEASYYRCQTGCGEGNGIYPENSPYPFEPVKRQMKRLDDVVAGRQFDFIKMDCQGSELDILRGGQETIKHAHVIQLESQVQEYNEGAPFFENVMLATRHWGFRLFDIVDFHYNSRGMLIQVDGLFVKYDSPLFKVRPLS